MPPRLPGMTAARRISNQAFNVFSTTSKALAERTSTLDSLLSIDESDRPSTRSPIIRRGNFGPPRGERTDANDRLLSLLGNAKDYRRVERASQLAAKPTTTAEELAKQSLGRALSKNIPRRWTAGDVYAPRDLSSNQMKKWKVRKNPERDVFDALNINPIDEYRNFAMMSEYMTPMGRIKHSRETGLRPRNQKRIAKAIRRSIGLGMMPSVHRHPELLYMLQEKREAYAAKRGGNARPGL